MVRHSNRKSPRATRCGRSGGGGVQATHRYQALAGALLALLAALACEKREAAVAPAAAPAPGSVVLARIGDEVVTVDDLGFVPARMKPEFRLEEVITRRLAAAEARRRGLADVPKTRERLIELRRNAARWEDALLRNALYNSIRLEARFSEDELKASYANNQSRYSEPHWKLRIQKFGSEAEARKSDAALGASGHLDPAKSESLDPVPAAEVPHEVQPLLAQLQQPGARRVVAIAGTWSLVETEEFLASVPLPFEVVRQKVEEDLRAIRAEDVLNDLLTRLHNEQVKIDEAALANYEKQRAEEVAAAGAPPAAAPAPAASVPERKQKPE